jgi:uncharacterized protein (DUF924 family)
MTHQDIIRFWFSEIDKKAHFTKDPEFDQLLAQRFGTTHTRATRCELFDWRVSAEGRLAEVIVLDQFSRNLFRDSPLAFASDSLALALAQEAVAAGLDQQLPAEQRIFLYMPYMHSESLAIHDAGMPLFESTGNENTIKYEVMHRDIIARFGRYPHRNECLGRESTPDEIEFLTQPGSSF